MPKDLSGAQTGMAPTNSINSPSLATARGRNVFPQTFKHLTTDRYGEYSPFFWAKAERGDVQNLFSNHNLHTFTMQSPMVSDVNMTKSFIKVPMQAIYPINWERMMVIPPDGDDVPNDCRALYDVTTHVKNLVDVIVNSHGVNVVKSLLLLEFIASHGSLFERFNYHFNFKFNYSDENDTYESVDFDFISNILWEKFLSYCDTYGISLVNDYDVTYYPTSDLNLLNTSSNFKYVSYRRFLEMLRFNSYTLSDSIEEFSFDEVFVEFVSGYDSVDHFDNTNSYFINIEPIISYQLACAQFGTNDFVDNIYSAKLYRENMLSLALDIEDIQVYRYNGVLTLYDVFSEHYFNLLIGSTSESSLDFFINLFQYQRSLRYGDYFTGAKTQPLAVGEYSAAVNNGEVSAIDITKSIQMQRLLNRVHLVRRKLGDYLAGIFGGQLPEAPKDVPIFLAHQKFDINGFVTENTGAAQLDNNVQNTATTKLGSADSSHIFEIEIDEPCYIIGMNSYESMRVYSKTLDRFAFHHDRYDDFIPQMQYIGDQDIKVVELDSSLNKHYAFGYVLRNMEYKQRISYASGGFINNLPSWAFITDNSDGTPAHDHIDSDYIRSSATEFDRFYKKLNGYSLGDYFHFIVVHTNVTSPARMMEYTPEILR